MQKLINYEGSSALLLRNNVDTDQIIPKQFLKKIGKTGFGQHLFFDWRILKNGELNPDFELNKPEFSNASILISGENFGCGSSREHAVWAILEYGFRIVIAKSFGDIFFNNCFKNSVLPIKLESEIWQELVEIVKQDSKTKLKIDVSSQTIKVSDKSIAFDIDSKNKDFLLKGLDEISWSLQFEKDISNFEATQKNSLPWLW